MLFAKRIKPGEVVSLSPADGGEILHISQVSMAKPTDSARTYLQVVQEGEAFNTCVLQKDRIESTSVDFFLATREEIKLKIDGGKNEVHVIGYFEPHGDSEDFSDEDEMLEEYETPGDVDSEDSEFEFRNHGKVEDLGESDDDAEDLDSDDPLSNKALLNVKKLVQKRKNLGKTSEEDSEEESEDAASLGRHDRNEEGKEGMIGGKNSKKRKTMQNVKEIPKKKKEIMAVSTLTKMSSAESEYEKALTDFLKKNGSTPLSTLGQKVKKPSGVEMKMTQFIKSRGALFRVDGGVCAIAN